MLPQEHSVQGAAGGQLFFASLGGQQLFQQVIDNGVGDARVVLAALDCGLAGVEVLPLLKAGAQGLIEVIRIMSKSN